MYHYRTTRLQAMLIRPDCSTRAATYLVIINTLKGLPRTTLDAAWGLPGLVTLYGIRILCGVLAKRYPRRGKQLVHYHILSRSTGNATARLLFFVGVLRNAFVLIVLTIAAWLYTRHRRSAKGQYPIKILQTVPSGFKHVGVPSTDSALLSALAPQLPVATIILLLEHIAISKCTL
jgi:solute carrier family 26 (sodium-independent sulfate anion transporter), member 11